MQILSALLAATAVMQLQATRTSRHNSLCFPSLALNIALSDLTANASKKICGAMHIGMMTPLHGTSKSMLLYTNPTMTR